MTLVLCSQCRRIGQPVESIGYESRDSMYDRPPTREAVVILTCEHCGSEELVDAHICAACGDTEATVTGTDYCESCNAESEAEQDAIVQEIKAHIVESHV